MPSTGDPDNRAGKRPMTNARPIPPPEDPIFAFEVEFNGDEVERLGRMLRAEDGPIFNDFLHDLALEAVQSWERKQPATPAATTVAD